MLTIFFSPPLNSAEERSNRSSISKAGTQRLEIVLAGRYRNIHDCSSVDQVIQNRRAEQLTVGMWTRTCHP